MSRVKDPEVNLARAKQLVILKHGIDADAGQEGFAPDQGLEAESSGASPGRQGQGHRQKARRPARGDRVSAQGRRRRAAAVQQFPRLSGSGFAMIFAIKAAVVNPHDRDFRFNAYKTMYGGKLIAKGDTDFYFREREGGRPRPGCARHCHSRGSNCKKARRRPANAASKH